MAEEKKTMKVVDVVSRDRNWTQRVNSELECEKKWDQQWGYLSSGFYLLLFQVLLLIIPQLSLL